MKTFDHFRSHVDRFLKASGMTERQLSMAVFGHHKFFTLFGRGSSSLRSISRVEEYIDAWFAEHRDAEARADSTPVDA